jgi:signal transduction histidine kinase
VGTARPAEDALQEALNRADHARATLNILQDFAEEGQQLKDTQLAVLNILEDSTADRQLAEAAVKATINILSDLTDVQDEVRTLNAGLEARVAERTAELKLANKSMEAFTYSVAHDLRSPLRALSGYSEALLEDFGDRLDEAGRGFAERIQAASERMGTLIDDLLRLSRVTRADIKLGPVNLSAEVAIMARELHTREPGRRVRFIIQDGIWVQADRTLIRTVIENLVENAWKFTSQRDSAIIELGTTTSDGHQLCCYLRDNGAGFDSAYAGKLFEPFQRLHAVTEFPGTGIGLASVQRIVNRHGGRIWAESAVGCGATFYFTLNAASGPGAR